MKPLILIALLLIAVGVVSLAYQGIRYTTQEKKAAIGPLQINTEQTHTIPLPPLVGIVALGTGITFLLLGTKKS